MENAERQNKLYKNKLTGMIRQARKDQFNKMLQENRHNIKGTWEILNKVLGNNHVSTNTPCFILLMKIIQNLKT